MLASNCNAVPIVHLGIAGGVVELKLGYNQIVKYTPEYVISMKCKICQFAAFEMAVQPHMIKNIRELGWHIAKGNIEAHYGIFLVSPQGVLYMQNDNSKNVLIDAVIPTNGQKIKNGDTILLGTFVGKFVIKEPNQQSTTPEMEKPDVFAQTSSGTSDALAKTPSEISEKPDVFAQTSSGTSDALAKTPSEISEESDVFAQTSSGTSDALAKTPSEISEKPDVFAQTSSETTDALAKKLSEISVKPKTD